MTSKTKLPKGLTFEKALERLAHRGVIVAERDVAAHRDIQAECDAAILVLLLPAQDDVLLQLEVGDAVDEQSARRRLGLEDRDIVSALDELVGTAQTSRSSPDDGDPFPRRSADRDDASLMTALIVNGKGFQFAAQDRRVVFAIPYERAFTLIGTTETATRAHPAEVRANEADVEYLLTSANTFFPRAHLVRATLEGLASLKPSFEAMASPGSQSTGSLSIVPSQSSSTPLSGTSVSGTSSGVQTSRSLSQV